MDQKRFLSFATAVACFVGMGSVAPVQVNAQEDPEPYANELEAADFATFNSTTSFSVQADLSIGQTFTWQSTSGLTFSYTSHHLGVHSFLVDLDQQKVTVYAGSAQVATLDMGQATFADSVNVTENDPNLILQQIAGTGSGIYDASNLFKNPGFETYATYTTGDSTTLAVSDTRGTPAFWDYTTSGWRLQNTRYQGDTYAGMFPVMEGNSAFMMHNNLGLLSQHLTGLQANQWYKVNWRQFAHGDTSPVTAYHAYILKDSATVAADGANVIAEYDYNSAPQGYGSYVDPLFAFRLPEGVTDVYFAVGKVQSNTINHFDMMTLVPISADVIKLSSFIEFDGDMVTWQEGLSAPVGGTPAIEGEDVTDQYMVNPSFEENVMEQVNISPYNPDASITTAKANDNNDGNNGGINKPYGWDVAYSTKIQAGDIWDQANVNDGQTWADKNSGKTTRLGLQPTDGQWFYYYRSRWYDNQDFTVSQTTKELPAGYYNITFDAGIPEGETPVTIEVGDYIVEMSENSMETYSFRINIPEPQAMRIAFSSFKDGNANNTAASLCVDNFHIYYCGEADEAAALASAIDLMDSYYTRLAEYDPYAYTDMLPAAVQKMWYEADDAYFAADQSSYNSVYSVVQMQRELLAACQEAVEPFATLKENLESCAPFIEMALPGLPEYQALYDAANEAAITVANDAYDTNAEKFTTEYCDSLSNLLIPASRAYVLSGVSTATEDTPYNIVANDLFQQVVSAPQFTTVGGDTSNSADASSTGWATDNGGAGGDFRLNTLSWARAEGDTVVTNCWNNWSNNFSTMELYQEIPNLPEGFYTITARETDNQTVWWDQHLFVSSLAGEAVGTTPTVDISNRAFGEFTDMPETEKIWVPEGGTLRIGMKSTSGGDVLGWFCVTDFELFYYPAPEGEGSNAVAKLAEEIEALAEANEGSTLGAEKDYISSVLAQAATISSESTSEEITAALTALQSAQDTIELCVTEYADFTTAVQTAQTLAADPAYEGADAETFNAVINRVVEEAAVAGEAGSGKDITYLDTLAMELDSATADFEYSYQMYQVTEIENSGALNGASEKNPIDLTDFIVNPTIEGTANNVMPEGWTVSLVNAGNDGMSNTSQHWDGTTTNRYLDGWNGTAGALDYRASQTIYVPNGQYILRCTARTDGAGAYIFANGDTVQIKNYAAEGGEIWEAAEDGSEIKLANNGNGWGWCQYELRCGVYNNTLTLGITNNCGYEDAAEWTGTWLSADDFQLFLVEKGWSVGIDEVGADSGAADFKVYTQNGYITVEGAENYTVYSISGMQVDATQQLPAGTYIVSANGKAVKVAVQ